MRRWWLPLVGIALALTACGMAPTSGPPPPVRVQAHVRVAGVDLGGLSREDAQRILEGLRERLNRPAQEPVIDPENRGLLPGTDGTALDVPATLRRVMGAKAGATVAPVLLPVPPLRALRALPPAPIYNAPRDRAAVAVVINIAWGDASVPGILAALSAARAQATFCLVGRWAAEHAALVHEIQQTGLRVGTPYAFCNHGYRDHGWALLGLPQARSSISQADRVIAQLTGQKPRYFSPHKGEFNAAVLEASRQEGHELVLWSLDTIDWQHPSPSTIRQRILSRVQPGDIILMHPTVEAEQALPEMIAGIRGKGLRLVTLNQLLGTRWPPSGTATAAPAGKG